MVLYHCLHQKEAVKTMSLPKLEMRKEKFACLGRQQEQQGEALQVQGETVMGLVMSHLAI
jgi:hypothetical protein